MAIQYIGSGSAIATSISIPTHQIGDLIVLVCGGSSSITVPAGWTVAAGNPASTNKCVYKFATSASETSGTFTNAIAMSVAVYRNVGAVGAYSTQALASLNNIRFLAVTPVISAGTSWFVGFSNTYNTTTEYQTAPSGMTNRTYSSNDTRETAIHDTNGGAASWSQTDVAATGVDGRTYVLELIAGPTIILQSVTETENDTTSTTSFNASLPATVNSGDLLLCFVTMGNDTPLTSTPAGWTLLAGSSGDRSWCYAKVAAGTEGGTTINFQTGSGGAWCSAVLRLSGWFGDLTNGVLASDAWANTSGTTSNLASSDPTWAQATFWVTAFAFDWASASNTEGTLAAEPSYAYRVSDVAGGSAAGLNSAQLYVYRYGQADGSAWDPSTYTLSAAETGRRSWAIAIREAVGGALFWAFP